MRTGKKINSSSVFSGCQGQVTASDFEECHGNCVKCIEDRPCDKCQYWPIYPCYSKDRPMVECLVEYVNDPISVDQDNPGKPSMSSIN